MNALEELEDALAEVVLRNSVSPLDKAMTAALNVKSKLGQSNPTLAEGWMSIFHFCDTIDVAITNRFNYLFDDIRAYIAASKENETQETNAVRKANEEAEAILKELGIH